MFFSSQDIVIGRYRDTEDRISWFLEHRQFETALQVAERERGLPPVVWETTVQVNDGGVGRGPAGEDVGGRGAGKGACGVRGEAWAKVGLQSRGGRRPAELGGEREGAWTRERGLPPIVC